MKSFQCPVCGNTTSVSPFQCKDYTVSKESFGIYTCEKCRYAYTRPQPAPQDIENYYLSEEYISHSDTKKGIVNRLYHIVRKRNTKDKLAVVSRFAAVRSSLLDVGCGTGYFLSVCRQNGWQVEGVELSNSARAVAEGRIGQPIFPSIAALEETGKRFDVITLWHVFEHLYDVNASFLQLKHLLKPEGGTLILALPNPLSADAVYYREYWAAYDVPRHLSHFSPESIRLLAEKHRMKIAATISMKFDAFYISMLSEGLKGSGKLKAFFNGFRHGYLSNHKAGKDGNYSSLIYVFK
ncbi:bifunctional 3-demethylubiquinone-9 3-methyltransferase/ 2-octaprenyl-6-hydroxy phenol methylase [Bacteroidales bacterium Barb6XT]|nr:bifunctional 3-demethylubiquinone-9 3-methyltransferase/ 2-octaprenyl-6-hydroxy phenol methylase [Bacteroidales bacterium Barb6XT]